MKINLILCLAGVALAGTSCADIPPGATPPPLIFNGTNLDGWVKMSEGTFVATNGVLHLEGGKGWLRTEKAYTNFIFEAEWRGLATNYNSGFFIRAARDAKPFPTWQVNTKQVAIGELLEDTNKIILSKQMPIPAGEWVKFHIEVCGHNMSLDVNGQRAWDFKQFTPDSGYIGLQAEGRAIDFRNLRVQELP